MKWIKYAQDVKGHKSGEIVELEDASADSLIALEVATKAEAPEDITKQATALSGSLKTFVDGRITAGLDAGFQRFTNALEANTTAIQTKRPGVGRIHENAEDDPNGGWKSINEQVGAIRKFFTPGQGDEVMKDDRVKRMFSLATKAGPTVSSNEAFGADGGFLLAPNFANQILDWSLDEEALLGITDNYTTSSNNLTVPSDETTPWSSDGVQGYWTAEGGQITQGKPKLQQDNIILQKLSVLVPVTDEMVQDSFTGIGQYVGKKAGLKIKYMTNDAIIAGNGSGKPLGFANSGAIVTQTKVAAQTAATVNITNAAAMYSRLPNPMAKRYMRWLVHPSVMPQLVILTNGNNSLYIGPGEVERKRGFLMDLLDIPVIVSQHCQVLGTQGDVYLADFSQYLTLTKGDGIQAAMSIHLFFDYNVSTFRFNYRVGGQPWPKSTIASANGTYPLAPFVQLESRS